MKVDKSLQEVWEWKDSIYEETKHLPLKEFVKKMKKDVEEIHKKYNLHLKRLNPSRR